MGAYGEDSYAVILLPGLLRSKRLAAAEHQLIMAIILYREEKSIALLISFGTGFGQRESWHPIILVLRRLFCSNSCTSRQQWSLPPPHLLIFPIYRFPKNKVAKS